MADLEAALDDGRLIHAGFTPNAGEDPGAEVDRILATLREPPEGVPPPTAVLKKDTRIWAVWVLREPTAARRLQRLDYRLGALDSDREVDLAAEVVAFDPALEYGIGEFQLDQPVLLMPDKFADGLNSLDQKGIKSFSPTPLEDVLRKDLKTDAHFSTYWPHDQDGPRLHCPRVNKECLPKIREKGYALTSWGAVFDLDLPGHADWTLDGLAQFEAEELPKIVELLSPSFYYTTSHGARIGCVYSRPVDVEEHEQILLGIMAQCAKAGIKLDASCCAWNGLFRAPRVVRDGKPSWEQWWFRAQEWPENRLDPSTAPRKAVAAKSGGGTERVQLDLGNLPEVDLDGWFPGSDADPDAPPLREHHRELIVRGCELVVVQELLERIPESVCPDERAKWEGWESRNEPQMAATCAMARAGMTDEQIGAVLLCDALGISRAVKQIADGRRRPKLDAYVERQIGRARVQVGEESRVAQKLAKLRAANDQVDISPGMLNSALDEVQEALIAKEVPLFQRGGKLVMPIRLDEDTGDLDEGILRKAGSLVLHQPNGSGLLSVFVRHCRFYKLEGPKAVPVWADPEVKLANIFAAGRERWRLPPLSGVTGVPVFRSDGSILQTPGYDPQTRLWYEPGTWSFPEVPEEPTKEDALRALEALRNPFNEYSIPRRESWSALYATLLSTVIAPRVDAIPMLGISSPDFGYGKTKIAKCIAIMATGGEGASMNQGPSEEEDGKRIDAALIAGDVVLSIDNCEKRPVGGDVICSVVTSGSHKPRRLGKSDVAEVPSKVLMIFNGVNLSFQADACRRALLVEIEDPNLKGKPWERDQFTFDPVELTKKTRGEMVAAALTILGAWHKAGRPKPKDHKPLGSFDGWEPARLALLWLGQGDPVKTQALIEEDDPQREEDRNLLDALWRTFNTRRFKARDLISDDKEALLGPLLVDDRGYPLSPRGVGKKLNRLRGSWVDGVRLVRSDDSGHKGMTYHIERGDGAQPPFQIQRDDGAQPPF